MRHALTFLLLFMLCRLVAQENIVTAKAGENIAAKSMVTFLPDGKVYLADNDLPTKRAFGYVKIAALQDSFLQVFLSGSFNYGASKPPGALAYLSGTAGAVTFTRPSGFSQVVGEFLDSTTFTLFFKDRVQYDVPEIVTTTAQTIKANVHTVIDAGASQSTFTINFPASPSNGDYVHITFKTAITTLTIGTSGVAIGGGITTAAINTAVQYQYFSETAAAGWQRQ